MFTASVSKAYAILTCYDSDFVWTEFIKSIFIRANYCQHSVYIAGNVNLISELALFLVLSLKYPLK